MKISKKLLYSMSLTSLICIFSISTVSFFQMSKIQENVYSENLLQREILDEKSRDIIVNRNEIIINDLVSSYANSINLRFKRISNNIVIAKSYAEIMYENIDLVIPSAVTETDFTIAPGVSASDVSDEIKLVNNFYNIFNIIPSFQDGLLKGFYVSEKGLIVYDTVADNDRYNYNENIDLRETSWYKGAQETNDIFWSEVYTPKSYSRKDGVTVKPVITCAVSVYNKDNEFMGVIAANINIDYVYSEFLINDSELFSYAFLLNSDNEFVVKPDNFDLDVLLGEARYNQMMSDISDPSKKSGSIMTENSAVGFETFEVNGWTLGIVLNSNILNDPVINIKNAITESNDTINVQIKNQIQTSAHTFILLIILIIFIMLSICKILSESITDPITQLQKGLDKRASGDLVHRININSGDEIEGLGKSFNQMADQIQIQIEQIAEVASQEQKLKSEIDIASVIQSQMLPEKISFPNLDIFGHMTPSKKVGGDFYDYFDIGNGNICFVIGDVSGKGLGASLFMTMTKVLIKSKSMSVQEPHEIFEHVNNVLVSENISNMYVTCFIGIYNPDTGIIKFSNAGHLPPLIKNLLDGTVRTLSVPNGLPLSCLENSKYVTESLLISKDELMLMFTDGVTEAENLDGVMLTDVVLSRMLAEAALFDSKTTVDTVKSWVDEFAKYTEQVDDITIMALKVQ